MTTTASLQTIHASQRCCNETWEEAYQRFETPAEEIAKFIRRLQQMGAEHWAKDEPILEIFCGRGNGLHALQQLGFGNLSGADLSADLVKAYEGPADMYVCDCRELPMPDATFSTVIVQGGLHHLPDLPADLERAVAECRRVLRPGGRLCVVEPWRTPFLDLVHFVTRQPVARRLWPKFDAFAVMTENEADTYFNWLSRPEEILASLGRNFTPRLSRTRWGKLMFVGEPHRSKAA